MVIIDVLKSFYRKIVIVFLLSSCTFIKIANKYNLWYMIDAAYGGPAVRSKNKKNLFKGIEKADSILINPHKWLYVPFEVACVMVRKKENLKKTFSLIPEYLNDGKNKEDREDLMNYNIQLILKTYLLIKYYVYFDHIYIQTQSIHSQY